MVKRSSEMKNPNTPDESRVRNEEFLDMGSIFTIKTPANIAAQLM